MKVPLCVSNHQISGAKNFEPADGNFRDNRKTIKEFIKKSEYHWSGIKFRIYIHIYKYITEIC